MKRYSGGILSRLRRWCRRRKVDRRIKRQAKAADVSYIPNALVGRALDINAWEHCGLKRRPGETDAELRRRCMDKFDEEYAKEPDWRHLKDG